MTRLLRPYIPLKVREQVALRQMREALIPLPWFAKYPRNAAVRLRILLRTLFGLGKVELHHRPSLVNREHTRDGGYKPDANNPDYLVYLRKDEHDIETRVRGIGAQLSDLAIARKRKRRERKETRRKTKWATRKLRSRSTFPKRRFSSMGKS